MSKGLIALIALVFVLSFSEVSKAQDCDTKQWLRVGLVDGLRTSTPGKEKVVFYKDNAREGAKYWLELSTLSKVATGRSKGITLYFADGSTLTKPKGQVTSSSHFDNESYKYECYFSLQAEEVSILKGKQIKDFQLGQVKNGELSKDASERLNHYLNCLILDDKKSLKIGE